MTVTVLRPAITMGPGIDGFVSRHLESPLQFAHVDDVAAAVWLAVTADRLQAHGWAPTWSNREILREFVDAHPAHLAIGRLQLCRRDLSVLILATVGLLVLGLGCRHNVRRRSW